MSEYYSAAFPKLSGKDQALSEGATKNPRRDRKRSDPKKNLLYTEEAPITTMGNLKNLLGLENLPEIDESLPFKMQVTAAFSQITPIPLATLMQRKIAQQETLEQIIIERNNLFDQECKLLTQLEQIQNKLKELEHQRWSQEEKMSQPPIHMVLRNLGDAIHFLTASDVKAAFDKIPENIQGILLRVPDLIPDKIKSSGKPVSQAVTVSQAFESVSQAVESDVRISETSRTPSDEHLFRCCSYLHRTPKTDAFVVLDTTQEMKEAFIKLEASGHPITAEIVIQNGISDDLTENPSLAIKNSANARHMQQPKGVIPIMILYHNTNERKVLEKIQNNFSEGVWPPSDKEMLDRLVAIRKKMFGYSAPSF
jgi:hypothetical protein